MVATARVGPGRRQETGTPARSPVWLSGTQVCQSFTLEVGLGVELPGLNWHAIGDAGVSSSHYPAEGQC